jgi:uncharacterized protein (DUF2062 family)
MPPELHDHHRRLLARRRWLRRLLRPLPRRANIKRYPVIKWFAERAARRPDLWSFKRQHVMRAIYVGSILSLLPLYGVQFALAALAALLLRANLTITIALQMLTNPFTVLPIYGFTAWLGSQSMRWLGIGAELPAPMFYAQALLIGGVIAGLGLAVLCDGLWRFAAWEAKRFRARHVRLRAAHAADSATPRPDPDADADA